MSTPTFSDRVASLRVLDDPTRRALLEFVRRSPSPVSRDQAAEALGIPRSTIAFHLDRLLQGALLSVSYQRLTGRTGPGAGRPAKLYSAGPGEVQVSVPERHYDLAASVLASAVDESASSGAPVADSLAAAAERAGRELAEGWSTLRDVLEANGFEPHDEPDGRVILRNCPFHRLVAEHPETVCTLNLHLLRGAACACGESVGDLELAPAPGRCCVVIRGDA